MHGLDQTTVDGVLADWRTAPVSDRMRATLSYLETLTLRPIEVTADSMRALLSAGVSDRAIREATYVAFLFSALNRLSDALDFDLPADREARRIGRILFRMGYGLGTLPG